MKQERPHWSEEVRLHRAIEDPDATIDPDATEDSDASVRPDSPLEPYAHASGPPPGRGGVRKVFWVLLAVVICGAAGAAAYLFWLEDYWNGAPATGSSTTLPAPTTTEPPPPLPNTYASPTLGCSFSYPEQWTEHSPDTVLGTEVKDPTAYLVGDPTTADTAGAPTRSVMFIGRRWPGGSPPSAREVVETMLADFESLRLSDTTVSLYEPATDLSVNGMEACSWAYLDRGTPDTQVVRTVAITSGDGSYLFEFRCPKDDLRACQTVFDAILVSFRPSDYSLLQDISTPSSSPTAFSSISSRCSPPPARSSRSMVAMVT